MYEMKGKYTENSKKKKRKAKLVTLLSISFLMAASCGLTSYAYERPNKKDEIEPNNTRETAQITQPTNEIKEKFAEDDWSGRHSIYGTATSSDDDWYKVDLPKGEQYLTVVHSYGDNATYVEMFDSKNNQIIPKTYGTRYNVIPFDSKGDTYYIHIVGASENENQYTLLVGTPMLTAAQSYVEFDPVNTSETITNPFSLTDEELLPDEALVARITLCDLPISFNGARVTSSSSSSSITYSKTSLSGNIGSLGMDLKSDWNIEFYPKTTVTSAPIVDFFYFYPVYDNTVYTPFLTLKR